MLLRIEDIDEGRVRPQFEAAIHEDLAWLGLTWPQPVMRQSDRGPAYADALARLRDSGVLYRCFKTRKEIAAAIASAPHGPVEVYRGPDAPMPVAESDARAAAGEPFAWRLSLAAARVRLDALWGRLAFCEEGRGPDGETGVICVEPDRLGDVVVARKDLGVAYHLAVVVDDAAQGVTHVVRGQDLFEAVHIQRLLQALLGLATPTYVHHPLVHGPDGKRLAKRDEGETLRALRERGATPQDVLATLPLVDL